jgi:hypothetical protein
VARECATERLPLPSFAQVQQAVTEAFASVFTLATAPLPALSYNHLIGAD